jgi:RNA-directed DNA polymerase
MFSKIQTTDDLAFMLGITVYELESLLKLSFLKYKKGTIPKKDGTPRTIEKPSKKLKAIQRTILKDVLLGVAIQKFDLKPKGQSHIKSVKAHIGVPHLLVSDIKDFFPRVHFSRVRKVFHDAGFPLNTANALARLTTKDYELPQGAPTSPILASIAITKFDKRLNGFCQKNNLTYTRFADDIAISGSHESNIELAMKYIHTFAEQDGLKLKPSKTGIFGPGKDKLIMGILVGNDGLQLEKNKLSQFLAELEKVSKEGPVNHVKGYKGYQNMRWSLLGQIAYIKQVEGVKSKNYCLAMQLFSSIDWSI